MSVRIEFTNRMLRELKGAPLSCIIAMSIVGQAVSAQYLEQNTGYSDKVVNNALLYLQENGYVTRNGRYAWRICMDVQQLPLMTLPEETPEEESIDEEVQEIIEAPAPSFHDVAERTKPCATRRNSESEKFRVPTSSSRSLTSFKTNHQDQLLLPEPDDPENLRVSENMVVCARFGIGEPTRSYLSKLPGVTTREIEYHCLAVKAKGFEVGAAIQRLKRGWPVPDDWIPPADRVDYSEYFNLENVCAQTLSHEDLAAWERVLESVKPDFRLADFEAWLKSAVPVRIETDRWVIRSGNQFSREWIRKNALQRLQEAAGVVIEIEGLD